MVSTPDKDTAAKWRAKWAEAHPEPQRETELQQYTRLLANKAAVAAACHAGRLPNISVVGPSGARAMTFAPMHREPWLAWWHARSEAFAEFVKYEWPALYERKVQQFLKEWDK